MLWSSIYITKGAKCPVETCYCFWFFSSMFCRFVFFFSFCKSSSECNMFYINTTTWLTLSAGNAAVLIWQLCQPGLQDGGPGSRCELNRVSVCPLDVLPWVHRAAAAAGSRGLMASPWHFTHPWSFTVDLDAAERDRQEDSLFVLPFGTCRGSHSLKMKMKGYELGVRDSRLFLPTQVSVTVGDGWGEIEGEDSGSWRVRGRWAGWQ